MKKTLAMLFVLIISQIIFAQTKIDEYERLNSDAESGRLTMLHSYILESPNSKGQILIYPKEKTPLGKILRHIYGIRAYTGLDNSSLIIETGRERKKPFNEIWLIKEGEKKISINSVSYEDKLNDKIKKKTLFDRECILCEPTVDLDQYIFRQGLDYFAKALKANPKASALIEIATVQYLSETKKERRELIAKIYNSLVKKHLIKQSRIKIEFIGSDNASFYLIPNSTRK
ncbi:MAG TPA: hypothetical protein PKY82_22820 [Pyrinomonadaceae bacterium]|nr:hypothetical protein [Pyrinomonadaceae bacterium]